MLFSDRFLKNVTCKDCGVAALSSLEDAARFSMVSSLGEGCDTVFNMTKKQQVQFSTREANVTMHLKI